MRVDFAPYNRALKLKQLGFDGPCFGRYYNEEFELDYGVWNSLDVEHIIAAPTFSQAFRWFREEYKFHAEIRSYTAKYFTIIIQELKDIVRYLEYGGIDLKFNTYEEAELACLDKLIEIVEGIESQK